MKDARKAKAALRRRMHAERALLTPAERTEAAARVSERLLALPEVRGARTVFVFASFGSEVPTGDLRARLTAAGVRVLLPFLRDGEMETSEVAPGAALQATTYGPSEPADPVAVDPAEIDVVVAPGLAFDRRGGRVGYGRGHFDRFLRRLGPRTLRVGIGFAFQLVDSVPTGGLDEPMDVVVTDRVVVRVRKGSGD